MRYKKVKGMSHKNREHIFMSACKGSILTDYDQSCWPKNEANKHDDTILHIFSNYFDSDLTPDTK